MLKLALLIAALVVLAFSPPARADIWRWPVQGEVLTPYRNGDDPYAGGQHRGIDIGAPAGSPVVAAVAGTVRFAGVAGSSGSTVSVRTGDEGFDVSYLHLASLDVRKGQVVSAGERLGSVGTSGRRSIQEPHLHFGVRDAGSKHAYRDPLGFLPSPPAPPAAPEGPRGAPAPEPVARAPEPVPVNPVPAPVPAPRRVPAGRRVPLGRHVPAGQRVPLGRRVPAGRRVRTPHSARGLSRVRGTAPSRSPSPVGGRPAPTGGRAAPTGGPAAHRSPGPIALDDLNTPLRSGPAAGQATPGPVTRGPGRPITDGARASAWPDLGWAVACLGLLLAAACIGTHPGRAREAAGRGRAALAALLRPLTGRG